MRRVPLNRITPDMRLAKNIYHDKAMVLSKGTSNLEKYVDGLTRLGIFSVYIDDDVSEDIEIPDAVSEETRDRCRNMLHSSFESIKKQGRFDENLVDETVNNLLEDLFSRPDVLISLREVGTTDDDTLVHSINTTVFSLLIGKQVQLSKTQMRVLAEGALFHDIGKTAVDSDVLLKNGKLTKDEFEHMKKHPELGYEILKKNHSVSELSRIIALQHHERLDGSGYPKGLKEDEIHYLSKIVAIADVYDALTAERCYRSSMSNYEAYSIIMQDSGSKLDANLMGALLKNVAIYPNGIIVNLSDGTHGIVKSQNKDMPFRPVVRVIDDINGETVKLYDLDLMNVLDITIVE